MHLFSSEREFLKKQVPNRILHFVIFIPVLLTALIPFFYRIHRGDASLVSGMSLLILGAFWFIQLQTVYVASQVMRRDWQEALPDEWVGTASKWQIIRAKFWAVVSHRWLWHLLITIALGGLALAMSGFLSRIPMLEKITSYADGTSSTQWVAFTPTWDRGILRDYITYTIHQPLNYMSHIPNPKAFAFAGLILAVSNVAAMIFSTSIGLALGRQQGTVRPILKRAAVGIVGFLIFGTFFFLRGTVLQDTFRMPFVEYCRDIPDQQWDCNQVERDVLLLRVVESTEQVGMALADGGTTSSAVLLFTHVEQTGYMSDGWLIESHFQNNFPPSVNFMFRHALNVLAASAIQIMLSLGLLIAAAYRVPGKNKSASD